MRPEDLYEFTRRKPFRPFRVKLTNGETFDVHHPEGAMVGKSVVAIGLPGAEPGGAMFDRIATLSLLHIMQIEPLETAPTNP